MSALSRIRVAAKLSSQLRQPSSRNYGLSAAQLDYDFYDEEEPQGKINRREMAEPEEWEMVGRSIQWIIMGDPMVRRHVYAERLAKLLDVPHISMGTLVRQELKPSSPLYKKIASSVNQGKLVPEDVIFGLLSKRLEEGYCRGESGFILDGIPRTHMQAEVLDKIADIDLVLNLKFVDESVLKKSVGNGVYPTSRDFDSITSSSSRFNLSLQPHVGHLQPSGAESDSIWTDKLRMYVEQRKSLEEYYERKKKLLDFQVDGALVDTWQGLLTALQLQHMNAVSSANLSQKLTA